VPGKIQIVDALKVLQLSSGADDFGGDEGMFEGPLVKNIFWIVPPSGGK